MLLAIDARGLVPLFAGGAKAAGYKDPHPTQSGIGEIWRRNLGVS
tara:strand:+ start:169 stop:303 length:135 start_codon:yes stop_codon:yes gene_type:complete